MIGFSIEKKYFATSSRMGGIAVLSIRSETESISDDSILSAQILERSERTLDAGLNTALSNFPAGATAISPFSSPGVYRDPRWNVAERRKILIYKPESYVIPELTFYSKTR